MIYFRCVQCKAIRQVSGETFFLHILFRYSKLCFQLNNKRFPFGWSENTDRLSVSSQWSTYAVSHRLSIRKIVSISQFKHVINIRVRLGVQIRWFHPALMRIWTLYMLCRIGCHQFSNLEQISLVLGIFLTFLQISSDRSNERFDPRSTDSVPSAVNGDCIETEVTRAGDFLDCPEIPSMGSAVDVLTASEVDVAVIWSFSLPDTWFRPPFWDLLMLQLLRPNSSNLPCLYSTFHLEYPLVLSRFYFSIILFIFFLGPFSANLARVDIIAHSVSKTFRMIVPRGDAGGLSREYVLRIPSML